MRSENNPGHPAGSERGRKASGSGSRISLEVSTPRSISVETIRRARRGVRPGSAGLALRQHRHGRVVGMDALGREVASQDRFDERHRLRLRGGDRALLVWMTRVVPENSIR
jgi:hypothetical protein